MNSDLEVYFKTYIKNDQSEKAGLVYLLQRGFAPKGFSLKYLFCILTLCVVLLLLPRHLCIGVIQIRYLYRLYNHYSHMMQRYKKDPDYQNWWVIKTRDANYYKPILNNIEKARSQNLRMNSFKVSSLVFFSANRW